MVISEISFLVNQSAEQIDIYDFNSYFWRRVPVNDRAILPLQINI